MFIEFSSCPRGSVCFLCSLLPARSPRRDFSVFGFGLLILSFVFFLDRALTCTTLPAYHSVRFPGVCFPAFWIHFKTSGSCSFTVICVACACPCRWDAVYISNKDRACIFWYVAFMECDTLTKWVKSRECSKSTNLGSNFTVWKPPY